MVIKSGIIGFVVLFGIGQAFAQVYVTPKAPENRTQYAPVQPGLVYVAPKKPQEYSNYLYGQNGSAPKPKVGQTMTAAEYNASLLEQKKITELQAGSKSDPPVQNFVAPVVPKTSVGVVVDDGQTYYDDSTGKFMKKSEFAAELWARGDDPNSAYPGKFPAPPAPPTPQTTGIVGWNNKMPK